MRRFRKIMKWTGIVLLIIGALALCFYLVVYFQTQQRINKQYAYTVPEITVPLDSASIARGAHLYYINSCEDCHGNDLSGKIFLNDPMLLRVTVPNLTRGNGGLPADFTTKDWVRVLMHGVNKEGRSLWIMPSHETAQLSKDDIACLIAYCTTKPPVATNNKQLHSIGPVGRLVVAFGEATILPAEKINHDKPLTNNETINVSAAYGKYLTVTCQGCHRPNMKGGGPLAPGFPHVPDISAAGEPGHWDESSFIKTIRTGQTPEGKRLRNEYMPWKNFNHFSDDELKSIYLYLQSLPRK